MVHEGRRGNPIGLPHNFRWRDAARAARVARVALAREAGYCTAAHPHVPLTNHAQDQLPMRVRLLATLALALVLPAAARAQSATAAINPVGKYSVQAVVQGQPADFELVIEKKDDGSFGGTLSNPNYGQSIISSMKIEGRTMKLVLATPQGIEATAEVTLAEDGTLDGSWSMQGDGGKMTGKRQP